MSVWSTRTGWKSANGYTLDYILYGEDIKASNYDVGRARDMLPTEYAPMRARIWRQPPPQASRSRRALPTPADWLRLALSGPLAREHARPAGRLDDWDRLLQADIPELGESAWRENPVG